MLFIKSILNLFRLIFLFFISLVFYIFCKNRAIYFFLRLAGPSFIKLGQALSVRSDLVGEELSKTLAKFQDKVSPFSSTKVRKILRQNFIDNFDEVFSQFNYESKASASIAQVHEAVLKNGDKVAVKILRPKIAQIMKRDIATLNLLAMIVKVFSRSFSKALQDVNQVLKETSKTEIDLMKEASMAIRLRQNLDCLSGFYVPKIYVEFTSEQILVSEWLDGIAFCDEQKIIASDFDKKQIAKNLVISYFTQVYRDGFFHADMHHGNLFLLKNGDIGVVDFGIMGEIDKKTRIAIAEILIAYLKKDYKKVAQIHVRAGLVPSDVNLLELTLFCQKIGEEMVGNSVKNISLASILSQLIKMTQKYKMSTKPELLLLQKTILLVEGVAMTLDENVNIWHLAQPWVEEWAQKNLGFDAKIRDFIVDFVDAMKKFVA